MSSKAETILNNGQYKIERVLGRGEYGITYQAFDVRRQQVVAIKTVNPNLRHHPEFAQFQHHFKAVARRLAQCQHPNLVKVWEVFEDRGLPFMVMNYIPGQPLIESLAPGSKLPVTQAIEYINQIAAALTEVHQQGIIHCNLTPKVIVRHPQTNQVILTDFGIASRFTDGRGENGLTRIAQPYLGSRNLSGGYAALEQYLPHEQLTTATDIYSLAAILHYLLTGTAPLEAPLCLSQVTETLLSPSKPSLRELRPDLSPTLERVILWGLELEQQHRPQNLDQWLGFLPELEDYAVVASNSGKKSESGFDRESSEILSESWSGDRIESEQMGRLSSIPGFVPLVFAITAILSGAIGFYLTRVYGGVYSQTTVFQSEESFDQQFPDYDPSKPVFQHPSVESKLMTNSMYGSDDRDFDYRNSDVLNGKESESQMASEKAWIEDPNYVSSDWEMESSDYQMVESDPGSIDGYYSESEISTTDSYSSDYSYSDDRYYSEYSSEDNYSSSYPSNSSEYSTPDYSNPSYSNSTPTRSTSNDYPAPATLDSPSYSSEYSPNPTTDSSSYPSSLESNQSNEYYSPSYSDVPEVDPSLETDSRPEFSPSDRSQWESESVPSRSSSDPYLETEIEYKFPGDSGSIPKFDAQSELPPSDSQTQWTASGSI
ncbi:serine/threonine protein kinase [Capilliphycus salinus ALCB114379]|uniref:serine/threonine protein kinase n=1 Tax=Capilliphycus salinus TaxID=2768948 RepID=UPI0039A47E81